MLKKKNAPRKSKMSPKVSKKAKGLKFKEAKRLIDNFQHP